MHKMRMEDSSVKPLSDRRISWKSVMSLISPTMQKEYRPQTLSRQIRHETRMGTLRVEKNDRLNSLIHHHEILICELGKRATTTYCVVPY